LQTGFAIDVGTLARSNVRDSPNVSSTKAAKRSQQKTLRCVIEDARAKGLNLLEHAGSIREGLIDERAWETPTENYSRETGCLQGTNRTFSRLTLDFLVVCLSSTLVSVHLKIFQALSALVFAFSNRFIFSLLF
jgi:hypothetical protein